MRQTGHPMGFLDRLLGREPEQTPPDATPSAPDCGTPPHTVNDATPGNRSDDEIALERYRYLLRTAPPETIEQVHEEAFAATRSGLRSPGTLERSLGAQGLASGSGVGSGMGSMFAGSILGSGDFGGGDFGGGFDF